MSNDYEGHDEYEEYGNVEEEAEKSWLEQNRWAGLLIVVVAVFAITQAPKLFTGSSESDEDDGRVDLVASYTIKIDESRSVKIDVDGWFEPTASVEEAEPGQTDVGIHSEGEVTFTNLSKERKVRSREEVLEHDLVVKVPRELCLLDEDRREVLEEDEAFADSNCQARIVHVEPRTLVLDGGESKSLDFSEFLDLSDMGPDGVVESFGSVAEKDETQWTTFINSGTAVAVAGADNRSKLVNGLNAECEVPLDDGGTATDVTFWSSDKNVDFCW